MTLDMAMNDFNSSILEWRKWLLKSITIWFWIISVSRVGTYSSNKGLTHLAENVTSAQAFWLAGDAWRDGLIGQERVCVRA